MTIAEKLLRAKADIDEVHEAGYNEGVDAIKTNEARTSDDLTASGATVTVPSGYYAVEATKIIDSVEQGAPSITVDSTGLIKASVTQSEGYVEEGTAEATKQLSTQSTKTITPSTAQQTAVASGRYTTGVVYVAGDAKLVPSNIKSGVSIFGVTGTFNDYDNGYATALRDYVPVIAQANAVPEFSGIVGNYYAPSVFIYEDFLGFSYDLESLVDIEITSSSSSLTVSIINYHTCLTAKIIVYAYCAVDENQEGDFEILQSVNVPPNSDNSVDIYCDRQTESYDWTYEIKGAHFYE